MKFKIEVFFIIIFAIISSATVCSEDNPVALMVVVNQEVIEGEAVIVNLYISQAQPQPVTFFYETLTFGLPGEVDLVPISGQVTFLPGELEKTLEIQTIDDNFYEKFSQDFFNIRFDDNPDFLNPDVIRSIQIIDNETLPQLSAESIMILEPADEPVLAHVKFTLVESISETPIQIEYSTVSGAAGEEDFRGAVQTITIEPGQTEFLAEVEILPDDVVEGDEALSIRLSSIKNAFFPESDPTITIRDPQSEWKGLSWDVPSEVINTQFPLDISFNAVNEEGSETVVFNESFDLLAQPEIPVGTIQISSIISIPNWSMPDDSASVVQITNTSNALIDLTGWQMVFYDRFSYPLPRGVYTFGESINEIQPLQTITVFCPASTNFPIRLPKEAYVNTGFTCVWISTLRNSIVEASFFAVSFLSPGEVVQDSFFSNIDPKSGLQGPSGSVLSGLGNFIYDFELIDPNIGIRESPWIFRYRGSDSDSGRDWKISSFRDYPTKSEVIRQISLPWDSMKYDSKIVIEDSNFLGSWDRQIDLDRLNQDFFLEAHFDSGQFYRSPLIKAISKPLFSVEAASHVTEPGVPELGVSQAEVIVTLDSPAASNIDFSIRSSIENQIFLPDNLSILAGNTQGSFMISALDNNLVDGVRDLTISLSHPDLGWIDIPLEVWDNEPNSITIEPSRSISVISESRTTESITLSLEHPVDVSVTIPLMLNLRDFISIPDVVVFEPNQKEVTFELNAISDSLHNVGGHLPGILEVQYGHWEPDVIEFTLLDDISEFAFIPEFEVIDFGINNGGYDNVFQEGIASEIQIRFLSSGGADIDLVVNITNPNPNRLSVPETVTIPSKNSSFTFEAFAFDNDEIDGDEPVTLSFVIEALTFEPFVFECEIRDDENPRVVINPIDQQVVAGFPVPLKAQIVNIDDSPILYYWPLFFSNFDPILRVVDEDGTQVDYEIRTTSPFSNQFRFGEFVGELIVRNTRSSSLRIEWETDQFGIIQSDPFIMTPAILNLLINPDRTFHLEFEQREGYQYHIEASEILESNTWDTIAGPFSGPSEMIRAPITEPNRLLRYFRIRISE